jgi:hypothetical protein
MVQQQRLVMTSYDMFVHNQQYSITG